ncbi:MAG: metallophosphoesterase [Candidatus Pristimantibacillus sp.]
MMKLRFAAIISSTLVIFFLINWYIGWNGWVLLSAIFPLENPLLYSIVIGIFSLAYLIGRLTQSFKIRPIAYLLKWIGSYWFAIIQYAVLLLPPADLIVWLLVKASLPASSAIIIVGTITFILMAALLIVGSWNAWMPVVRTYHVTIPKKAGSLDKIRIGMVSDIHLGTIVGKRHLERLVSEMDKMKPDIILMPGDVIDDDIKPFIQDDMGSVMRKLHAPLGIYAVLGNHEYFGGHIQQFVNEMKAIDIHVLQDESILIEDSFYIIGRKDATAQRSDVEGRQSISSLTAAVDHSLPLIMMDHQPTDLGQAAANGIDLSLSGHTHRGQMAPNHLITRRLFELDWGYMKKEGLNAIVSSGFGTWGPPVRIGSRSEVIQIEVKFRPV